MTTLSITLLTLGTLLMALMLNQFFIEVGENVDHFSWKMKGLFILGAAFIMLAIATYPIYKDSKETLGETVMDFLPKGTIYYSIRGYMVSEPDGNATLDTWYAWFGACKCGYYHKDIDTAESLAEYYRMTMVDAVGVMRAHRAIEAQKDEK